MSHIHTEEELQKIWASVPPDYYQQGVTHNYLQRRWHTGKLSTVLSLIEGQPKTILDVGSASGWFLSQVHMRHPRAICTGLDVYDKAIEYAKKMYPQLTFILADGHKLPLKANSQELVLCNEVLEHVVDPVVVLEEIKRVMSSNGSAIIEMDSGNWMFQASWYWWTHMRHGVWEDAHIQVFNAKKLEKTILNAGFRITKKKFFNFGMAVAFQVKKK